MAKIIKVTDDLLTIFKDDGSQITVPNKNLNFYPTAGTEVEIFESDEETIILKKETEEKDSGINVNIDNSNSVQQTQSQSVNTLVQAGKVVNKWVYVILALFLGGIGVHKFYAGKTGQGILYLVLCWTGIPSILGLIEAIIAAFKTSDANGNIVIA